MRSLYVLMVLAFLFSVPSMAQTATLPLVYVTNDGTHQNLYVMDVNSGEILFQSLAEEQNCPISLSDNGRWLSYWYQEGVSITNYLYDLQTGTSESLPAGNLVETAWSSDYRYLAYHYQYYAAGNVNSFSIYDIEREAEVLYDAMPATAYVDQYTSRFVNSDFLYAVVDSEKGILYFRRWDGNELNYEQYVDDAFKRWDSLAISPNGRYIIGYANEGVYLLELETDLVSLLTSNEAYNRLQWLPDEAASLLYLVAGENTVSAEIFYALSNPADNEAAILPDYEYILSPDANYLLYKVPDEAEGSNALNLWLMNRTNGELTEITHSHRWSTAVRWLSPSQFVYIWREPDAETHSDIYLYDLNIGESRQLTNTPELDERLECFLG